MKWVTFLLITLVLMGCVKQNADSGEIEEIDKIKDVEEIDEAETIIEVEKTAEIKPVKVQEPEVKVPMEKVQEKEMAEEVGPADVESVIFDLSREIKEMIDRGKQKENYVYDFTSRVKNKFDGYHLEGFKVSYKDGKVKKDLGGPIKLTIKDYITHVYVDYKAGTAIGVCRGSTFRCDQIVNNGYKLEFRAEKLEVVPSDFLDEIVDALKIEEQRVDQRAAVVLEYKKEGNLVRVFIDKFYGLPLRYELYDISKEERLLLADYRFSFTNVGGVKDSDVALPEGLTLV